MAAKDYQICPALFNVYIAKVSKRDPNKMTNDRRAITENEILMLIDWFANKELVDTHNALSFPSAREGKRIQLRFIDEK